MKDILEIKIIVHPECMMEVVNLADVVGSTSRIIQTIEQSPAGEGASRRSARNRIWSIDCTASDPEREIHVLSARPSVCGSMSRISLPRLCWTVENLAAGTSVNVIEVEPEDAARWALESLQRMLAVK